MTAEKTPQPHGGEQELPKNEHTTLLFEFAPETSNAEVFAAVMEVVEKMDDEWEAFCGDDRIKPIDQVAEKLAELAVKYSGNATLEPVVKWATKEAWEAFKSGHLFKEQVTMGILGDRPLNMHVRADQYTDRPNNYDPLMIYMVLPMYVKRGEQYIYDNNTFFLGTSTQYSGQELASDMVRLGGMRENLVRFSFALGDGKDVAVNKLVSKYMEKNSEKSSEKPSENP